MSIISYLWPLQITGILDLLCDVGEVAPPVCALVFSFLRLEFSHILSAVNFSNSKLGFIHDHPNLLAFT